MIENLTDSQILLLYLAEELPEDVRHTVEQRLAAEPALQSELEQLRSIHEEFQGRLEHADAITGLPVNISAMARSVGREFRQRLAEPRISVVVKKQQVVRNFRPWLISSGVAAAILVAAAMWINHSAVSPAPNKPLVAVTTFPSQDENFDLLNVSFDPQGGGLADAVITNSSPKDAAPRDDVSQYLLNLGTGRIS